MREIPCWAMNSYDCLVSASEGGKAGSRSLFFFFFLNSCTYCAQTESFTTRHLILLILLFAILDVGFFLNWDLIVY